MSNDTTPILLNLDPSYMEEPQISNDEFLDSLAKIGVWLRVLTAHDSLERFSSPKSTSAQRLAALSNIYLQFGAQVEDQAVALVAFSVWSRDRDLVLADLFSRVFVRRKVQTPGSEIQEVHDRLGSASTKAVPVDLKAFFSEVAEMSDTEVIDFFLGYKWKPFPSVKLIPTRHIETWRILPVELRRIAGSFCHDTQVPRLTAAYNKIKHGPQLVIQNPVDRAKRFSNPRDFGAQLAEYPSFDKLGVRLLFDGANTGPESEDGGGRSVAPFLIDDAQAVKRIFFNNMVHQASMLGALVKMQIALYRKTHASFGDLDEGIRRIIEAKRTFLTIKPEPGYQ